MASSSLITAARPRPVTANDDEFFMKIALKVAQRALEVGEVPVGCVIVMTMTKQSVVQEEKSLAGATTENDEFSSVECTFSKEKREVGNSIIEYGQDWFVVSHGANQVNATRDATRHAEMVAIDRMLTGGKSSDQLRLPAHVIAQSARSGMLPPQSPLLQYQEGNKKPLEEYLGDATSSLWEEEHSSLIDSYGWGSGRIHDMSDFKRCKLYVTCEPCIMCAAVLAQVGIGKVIFGCRNDKFGGCGSILDLHKETGDRKLHPYPIASGIMEEEAVALLRSFYDRENFHAPDHRRRRKEYFKKL